MKILMNPEEHEPKEAEIFETVEQFKDWYCNSSKAKIFEQIPLAAFSYYMEGLTALTLCRRGNCQVELLIGQSGYWYEGEIIAGQQCYFSYQGGHVLIKYLDGGVREWNPESYIDEYSVINAREESPSWAGEGGSYQEGDKFQFSFGAQGGVILAYSQREDSYSSCLETVKIIDKIL